MRGWRRIPTKAELAAHMQMMRDSRDTFGLTVEDRLWANTDRTGGPNACWEWQGALIKGYGRIWVGDTGEHQRMYTHRLAWFLAGNIVTEDKPLVLHKCDHPPCCNPDHLYAGNMKDNARDAFQRGTRVRHKNKALEAA